MEARRPLSATSREHSGSGDWRISNFHGGSTT